MSIPIPSLPTDNLYKFMALTGLFVGVTCLFFAELQIEKTDKLVTEVTASIENQEFLMDLINPENNYNLTEEQKLNLKDKLFDDIQNSRDKHAQSGKDIETIKRRLKPIMIVSFLGFLTSILGFNLWYFRVQKLLDEILQSNLALAKANIGQPEPPK